MREVDWDLLADHLGGALADSRTERQVADLIATDPAWAWAASELSAALAAVATDLRALPDPVLPDDVAARLEEALSGAGQRRGRATGGHLAGSQVAAAQGSRRASRTGPGRKAGPDRERGPDDRGGSRRPAGRPASRRRLARWGSGLAVAAGLVAFAAFGISNLGGMVIGGDDASGIAADRGNQAEAAPVSPSDSEPPQLLASGYDYRRGELSQRSGSSGTPLHAPDGPLGQPDVAGAPDLDAEDGSDLVPEALRHLWPLPEQCLSAVIASYQAEAVRPRAVDFAYFEGQPSIVIWVTTEQGASWVSVVGPGCGSTTAGIDERHRSQLD